MDHGYMHPRLRGCRESLVILAQSAVSTQPSQRPLNHPSPWQHFESMAVPRTPHNLQDVSRIGSDPVNQPAGVSGISPNQFQPWESTHQTADNRLCPVPILDIGRVDYYRQQQPYGVDDDVSLASCDFLAGVIATRPPFSVVLTDWLSIMPTLGVHSFPSACRT